MAYNSFHWDLQLVPEGFLEGNGWQEKDREEKASLLAGHCLQIRQGRAAAVHSHRRWHPQHKTNRLWQDREEWKAAVSLWFQLTCPQVVVPADFTVHKIIRLSIVSVSEAGGGRGGDCYLTPKAP